MQSTTTLTSKFKIRAEDLCEVVGSLSSIIPAKPVRDSLKNIKVTVNLQNQEVILFASDQDVYSSLKIDTNTNKELTVFIEGQFLVTADVFLNYLKSFGKNIISVSSTENMLTLADEISTFEVALSDIDEYPTFPEQLDGESATINSDNLNELLKKTVFSAADKSNFKYNLSAIRLNFKDGKITASSTDSKRASLISVDAVVPAQYVDKKILLSAKAANLLLNINFTLTRVIVSDTRIMFKLNNGYISFSLIAGNFPDVEAILPKNYINNITIDPRMFNAAIKKAILAADSSLPKLALSFEENLIRIEAKSKEKAKKSSIEYACSYVGPKMIIGLNGNYLIDMLKIVASESIKFKFKSEDTPLLFEDGENFSHLISPQEV